MKRRKKKKTSTNNMIGIFTHNPMLNVTPMQQIMDNIISEAQKLRGNNLDIFFNKVFKHPLCPPSIHCRYKTRKTFLDNYIYNFFSLNEELVWFKNLFLINSTLLKSFLDKKNIIDVHILNSNIDDAIDEISKIEDKICLSFWAIELRVNITKELLDEDTSEYLAELKEDINSNVADFYIQQILLRSENKDIHGFIDNLTEVLDEMRNSVDQGDIHNFANLASSYFLPFEYDKNRDINNRALSNITNYPIIDQYLLFKKFVIDKVSGLNP